MEKVIVIGAFSLATAVGVAVLVKGVRQNDTFHIIFGTFMAVFNIGIGLLTVGRNMK